MPRPERRVLGNAVTPAKAGAQYSEFPDSRFRGHDKMTQGRMT